MATWACQVFLWLNILHTIINFPFADGSSACNWVEFGWLPLKVDECSYGYINGQDVSYKATCRLDGRGEITKFNNTIFCTDDYGSETTVLSNSQCDAEYECEIFGAKYLSYTNGNCNKENNDDSNDSNDSNDKGCPKSSDSIFFKIGLN